MSFKVACKILDIDENKVLCIETLKKQYRHKALQYHPDKNNHIDATRQFQDIKEAYEYLKKVIGDNEKINTDSYSILLNEFLRGVIYTDNGDIRLTLINEIISKIFTTCYENISDLLERVDERILNDVYEILKKYNFIFGDFNNELMKKIKKVLDLNTGEYIILNPSIDDLLDCNLYKISRDSGTLFIPLWHHEMIFDNSGIDIKVKCRAQLEPNIFIDEDNNIHIELKYNISELWNRDKIDFKIGEHLFGFNMSELSFSDTQTIRIPNMGIPHIDTNNVYNIDKKMDLFVYIIINL